MESAEERLQAKVEQAEYLGEVLFAVGGPVLPVEMALAMCGFREGKDPQVVAQSILHERMLKSRSELKPMHSTFENYARASRNLAGVNVKEVAPIF